MAMAMAMATNMAKNQGAGVRFRFKEASIGIVTMAVAGAVGMAAFANVVRNRSPLLVPSFWSDPLARLSAWEKVIAAQPARARDERSKEVALAVLKTQPLNANALRLLALWEDSRGETKGAHSLATLAEKVSRRDLLNQLFLLEAAVGQGNIQEALDHYDKALRVSPESKQLLFPVLIEALKDPAIRERFGDYVDHAPWVGGLLFAALDAKDGAATIAELLLQPSVSRGSHQMAEISGDVLKRLLDRQEYTLAARLFIKLPSTRPEMLRDLAFTNRTIDPSYGLFSWQIADNAAASVAFEDAGAGRRNLYAELPTGAIENPLLVRRIVNLAAGEYSFSEVRHKELPGWSLFWELVCFRRGAMPTTLWQYSQDVQRGRSPHLVVPSDCPWQEIRLVASKTDSVGAGAVTIDRIMFERVTSSSSASKTREPRQNMNGRALA